MSTTRRTLWLGLGAVLVAGVGVSSLFGRATEDSAKNRIWLDRMPERPEEHRNVLLFLEQGDEALANEDEGVGIFQRASSFEGDFELFSFRETAKDRYELTMLQKKSKHRIVARVSSCNERGFDFCLDVTGAPRGPARYYSKRGWEIDGDATVREATDRALRIGADVD